MAVTPEQQQKIDKFNELFTRNRSGNEPLSREEGNELDALQRELNAIEDEEVQGKISQIVENTNEKVRKDKEKSRRRTVGAAEAVADASTKLAFDKEKAPNLTVASSCYLRRNIHAFLQDSFHKNPLGWSSFMCWHADKDIPFGSGMLGYSGDGSIQNDPDTRFLNLSNQDYTILKPKIRLFKTIVDSSGKIKNEIEMSFPTDGKEKIATELLMPTTSDAGIKSVTVDFKNQNAFAASRMVDVQMEIVMAGGDAFTRPRGFKGGIENFDAEANTYSIKDLLLRGAQLDPSRYDGHHYGIKMSIGYEQPRVVTSLTQSIIRNTVTMVLQLIEYDLNVQQNGTLSLLLQYKGRVEAQLENKERYDIFDFNGGSRSQIKDTATSIGDTERQLENTQNALSKKQKELIEIGIQRDSLPMKAGTTQLVAGEIEYIEPDQSEIKKLDRTYEQKEKEINELKQKLAGLNDEKTDLEKEYTALTSENKILKYSRILDKMNQEGKIYNVVLKLTELILYGPEFRALLQRKIDIINNEASETDTDEQRRDRALRIAALESASRLSEKESRAVVAQQIAEQSQGSTDKNSFLGKLKSDIRAKAEAIAAEEGDGTPTEDNYKAAAAGINDPIAYLQSVDSVKPEAGVADSDSSLRQKKRIYFFYYGDLLDTAMRLNPNWQGQVYTQMEYDRNGIIMGPAMCETGDGESNKLLSFNVADVPIPVELYQEFFQKNIINKDIDQYNVSDFIKDTMYQLVAVFLNQKCTGESVRYPVSVQTNTMAVGMPKLAANESEALYNAREKKSGVGDYDKYGSLDFSTNCPLRLRSSADLTRFVSAHEGRRPKVDPAYNNRFYLDKGTVKRIEYLRTEVQASPSEQIWNYNMYSLEVSARKSLFKGDPVRDAAAGIHHLYVGNDRGLVKSINFNKVRNPALTAMQVARAHEQKEENIELWSTFHLDLKMVGNALFKPGMHLYLNPTLPGFGDPKDRASLSRTLGLGGYYLVTSVSNNLLPNWETSVQAKWVSHPVKDEEAPEILQPVQAKTRFDAAVSAVVVLDDEGLFQGTDRTRLIIKKSTPSTPEPKGKGQPMPVGQQLQDSANQLQTGVSAGNQTELKNLSAQAGFTTYLQQQYYKTQQKVEGGNNFTYDIANVNAETESQRAPANQFMEQFNAAKANMQTTSEGAEVQFGGKKAKMYSFSTPERGLQAALFIYGGETLEGSETPEGGTGPADAKNIIIFAERAKEE